MAKVVAVGHVGLNARDLSSLAAFYRDVVGLRQTVFYEGVVAIFALGDTPTDLFLSPGNSEPVGFDLAGDDVDAFREKLARSGVACGEAKDDKVTGHRGFSFRDPEGNEIRIRNAHGRS